MTLSRQDRIASDRIAAIDLDRAGDPPVAEVPPARRTLFSRQPRELICSELWGGNQSMASDIRLPGMTGMIFSSPCTGKAGGDVYYLSACSAGLVARLALADVVGHGEAVSQMSEWMYESLRRNMNRPDPSVIFEDVNRRALAKGIGAMTTAVCVTYYSLRSTLYFCYAGHHPALIYRKSEGRWRRLEVSESGGRSPRNLPLAVDGSARFDVNTARIESGDRILVYSDGLIEAPNRKGGQFGEPRLLRILETHAGESCQMLGEMLLSNLRRFTGRCGWPEAHFDHDDVTFVLLEATSPPRGFKMWHMMRNHARKWLKRSSQAKS